MLSARTSAGVAFSPSSAVAASPGREFRTMNVRSVTPQSTGMAMSTRRPATRRAGESGRRRWRGAPPAWPPGSGLELSGCPTVTEVFMATAARASSVVVHVLPHDLRVHDLARDRGGQPGPADAMGGDVVAGDGEKEAP